MIYDFSIVEFGSKSRGTSDEYSDNDLLIVVENKKDFDYSVIEKYITNPAFSISYYNYEKLKFLAGQGSLFVQHLKKEGKIIEDKSGQLGKILKQFKPKKNYYKELVDSKEYFRFISYIPNTEIGMYWFCDCMYVGLRNFLVLVSANDNDYIFSYPELLQRLHSRGTISNNEYEDLKKLRIIKQNYRTRKIVKINKQYIIKLKKIFSKIGLYITNSFKEATDVKIDMIEKIHDPSYDSYQKLRIFECAYICSGKKNSMIEKLIRNPQFYTQQFKNEQKIKKYLMLIK